MFWNLFIWRNQLQILLQDLVTGNSEVSWESPVQKSSWHRNVQNFQTGQGLGSHHLLPAGRADPSIKRARTSTGKPKTESDAHKEADREESKETAGPLEVISNKNPLVSRESYDLSNRVGFPGNRSPEPVRSTASFVIFPETGSRLPVSG